MVPDSTADNPDRGSLLRRLVVGAVLLAVTLLASTGSATVVTYADLGDLVKYSDTIIRGEVVEQRTLYDSDQQRIITRTSFRVDERYLDESGAADGSVTIEQWGGTWEGKTSVVPGDASFEPGEEVVVFLRHGPDGGLYLTSLAQSKFTITRGGDGPLVTRDLTDLVFVEEAKEPAEGERSTFRLGEETRRLEVFEAELRSLIYARGGGSP